MDIMLALIAVLSLVILVGLVRRLISKNVNLPPGPPGYPLIGNIFDIPRQYAWLAFTQWGQLYGDVVHVSVLGQSLVILNSVEAVSDLLDARSQIYSDRPFFTMVGELMGVGDLMVLSQYGPNWRELRKLTHTALNTDAVKQYYRAQEDHVYTFLNGLLDRPQDFSEDARRAIGRITLSVSYGLPYDIMEPFVREAEETLDMLSMAMQPGSFLVDVLPFLKHVPKWVPGSPRRVGDAGKAQVEDLLNHPMEHVQSVMASGSAPSSYAADVIRKLFDDDSYSNSTPNASLAKAQSKAKWASGGLYTAGVETSFSPVITFILAMVQNPAVQKRAQEEVDRVLSGTRLPQVEDLQDLPYLMAIIKECLRWKPVLPLSLPRRLREADVYKGFYIPANSTVLPNIWAISRQECGAYPPDKFVPDRFLKSDGPAIADPFDYAFGFGKRSCPGKRLGLNNVMLMTSSLLASFDILPVKGKDGKPVIPNPDFVSGLASFAGPFKANFRPRSAEIASVIKEAVANI